MLWTLHSQLSNFISWVFVFEVAGAGAGRGGEREREKEGREERKE